MPRWRFITRFTLISTNFGRFYFRTPRRPKNKNVRNFWCLKIFMSEIFQTYNFSKIKKLLLNVSP